MSKNFLKMFWIYMTLTIPLYGYMAYNAAQKNKGPLDNLIEKMPFESSSGLSLDIMDSLLLAVLFLAFWVPKKILSKLTDRLLDLNTSPNKPNQQITAYIIHVVFLELIAILGLIQVIAYHRPFSVYIAYAVVATIAFVRSYPTNETLARILGLKIA